MLPQSADALAGYGFVVALASEARTLCRRPPASGQTLTFGEGCRLAVSGMGGVRAAEAALRLVGEGCRGIVSWGTCGGLASGLMPGSLVVATEVLAVDGRRYRAGTLRPPGAHHGTILSVSEPVASVEEKALLAQQFGALAVDMESAALARTACECGVDFVVVRAVVDPAQEALPAVLARAVDGFGHVHALALLQGLGVNARRWRELWRLASHFRRARSALADLARTLPALSGSA